MGRGPRPRTAVFCPILVHALCQAFGKLQTYARIMCMFNLFTLSHPIYLPFHTLFPPPFQTQLTRTSSSSKLNERLCFYIGQLMLLASICFFIQWNTLRAHLSATPVPTRDAPPLVLFLLGTGMLVLAYVRYFCGFLCYQCRGICILVYI